jgi:hypothetical protein
MFRNFIFIFTGARKPMINGGIRVHENVGQSEGRRKAIRMLVAVVVVFAICFLPNHTLNILRCVF